MSDTEVHEHHYVPILNGTVMWCAGCGDRKELVMDDDTDLEYEPFDPDWCIHPGVTFNECLKERGIGYSTLVTKEWLSTFPYAALPRLHHFQEIEITYGIADQIVELLGEPKTNPTFWVNLSNNYQAALRAGKKDTTPRDVTPWE